MDKSLKHRIRYFLKIRKARRKAIVGRCLEVNRTFRIRSSAPRENMVIGDNCSLGCQLLAGPQGKLTIGDHTYIGLRTIIGAKESVEIGRCVIISDDVIIFDNNNHPTDPKARQAMSESGEFYGPLWSWAHAASKPVVIEENVWIGKKVTIMKGVRIGRGSIVGIGAVVTRDVPPYSIVGGNPARVVKELPH